MLGPTLWKQVILIRNANTEGHYPRSLGAVVFEMGRMLWFYTSTDGTQSLSVLRGHAMQDEEDFGPLLLRIDPGFTHWEYDSAFVGPDEGGPIPPNACFLQSISLLRHRLSAGLGAEHARLLSYYVSLPTGTKGHTVLYIETGEGPTVIDPLQQRRPLRVRNVDAQDARSVACSIRRDVASARWVGIDSQDFSIEREFGAYAGNN